MVEVPGEQSQLLCCLTPTRALTPSSPDSRVVGGGGQGEEIPRLLLVQAPPSKQRCSTEAVQAHGEATHCSLTDAVGGQGRRESSARCITGWSPL